LVENEHGTTTAKGNRRARGSWLKTGGCLREEAGLMVLPDIENGQIDCPTIEDGSRLAPMHRFHDPSGALFATLPQ